MAGEKQHRTLADSDTETWSKKHNHIVRDEVAAINTRRDKGRTIPDPQPDKMINVAGLAFSGGGIRSASVCLGVLQALNHHDCIPRIDYLSTVSGGGYIGSSFTATMTKEEKFVFGAAAQTTTAEKASDISDTPAVGHIRNYSNYLIPAGARDLLTGVAIVVRGLVANLALTLPIVLILAAITIWSTPLRTCLTVPNLFGVDVATGAPNKCVLHQFWLIDHYGFVAVGALLALLLLIASGLVYLLLRQTVGKSWSIFLAYGAGVVFVVGVTCAFASLLPVSHFALTLAAALLGLLLFFLWALKQSLAAPDEQQEFRGHLPTMGATFLVLLAAIAFFEFQPFVIKEMFDIGDGGAPNGVVYGLTINWIKSLAAITAPIAGLVTLFRQQFAEFMKGSSVSSELGSVVLAVAAKAAVWAAGLALPLLIWVAYLYLALRVF